MSVYCIHVTVQWPIPQFCLIWDQTKLIFWIVFNVSQPKWIPETFQWLSFRHLFNIICFEVIESLWSNCIQISEYTKKKEQTSEIYSPIDTIFMTWLLMNEVLLNLHMTITIIWHKYTSLTITAICSRKYFNVDSQQLKLTIMNIFNIFMLHYSN